MSDKPFEPNIALLPNTQRTPELVLMRALQKLEHVKAVTIVVQWADNTIGVEWSGMASGDLLMAALMLQDRAREIMTVSDKPK